jgi:hypothetical protein
MAEDGETVMLNDRFELKPAARLNQFDQGAAQAFAVSEPGAPGRKLFALIAPGKMPCRALHLPERRNPMPLLWPEAVGVVDWPVSVQGGQPVWGRRPALVYAQPAGMRLVTADDQTLPRINEQTIARTVIKPAIQMLRELGHMGIAHRAIRLNNVFYAAGNTGDVVFGECFSGVPGADQPAVFETIENGIANRLGRAPGTQADDLYALGVLLLFLHLGRNPLQGMSDEQVVAAKIGYGSFSALTGGEKVSPTMAELLRGLLSDKLNERWTIRNLDMWMLGQYFNPVLPVLPQRATRPIRFGGAEHMSKPALANAMAHHWDEAVSISDGPQLEAWLKRGFNDEKAGEPLAHVKALAFSYGPANGAKHRTVTRLINFMGPTYPVCYKSLRVDVTGLAAQLAAVIDQPPVRTEFVEMLRGKLVQSWLDNQPKLPLEYAAMRRVVDAIDKFIERPGPGYGVERALYELDPRMPCRSGLIEDFYVTSLRDLLTAIDAALPGAPAGTVPMDRHIASFIAARIGRPVERELAPLANPGDQIAYRLGVLRLIAEVQRINMNHDLPRLAATMADLLAPVVDSFHRLKARDEIREQLAQFAERSDFVAMSEILDEDGPVRRIDQHGFDEAKQKYAQLETEAAWLEAGGLTHPDRIAGASAVSSAITSAFIASAIFAAFAVAMVV